MTLLLVIVQVKILCFLREILFNKIYFQTPAKTYGIPNTIPFINYKYKLSQITSLESGTVAGNM